MSIPETLGLGMLVFCATCALDFAHANYVIAVNARRRVRAASWSVAQWGASMVGFIVAFKVSLYLIPFEAAGLFVGTLLAVPKALPELPADLPEARVVPRQDHQAS